MVPHRVPFCQVPIACRKVAQYVGDLKLSPGQMTRFLADVYQVSVLGALEYKSRVTDSRQCNASYSWDANEQPRRRRKDLTWISNFELDRF